MIDVHSCKVKGKQTSSKIDFTVEYNKSLNDAVKNANCGELISLHNHPTENLPTGSDFSSMGSRGYHSGVVACHNGKVYWYKTGDKPFSAGALDGRIKKYDQTFGYSVENQKKYWMNLKEIMELIGGSYYD